MYLFHTEMMRFSSLFFVQTSQSVTTALTIAKALTKQQLLE